jgi:isopenicillin N synthase-like dioxygenase
MQIDVIDYRSSSCGRELAASLHQTGFGVLANHPIPQELVETVYEEWSKFFESEEKYNYRFTPEDQDGYFPAPPSSEITDRDDKEFFHVFPWGKYPEEVSDAALRYRLLAMEVAASLLTKVEAHLPSAVRTRLSMPLSSMLAGGEENTLLRILRYPPVVSPAHDRTLRAGAHEDTNLLTLLPASSEPGLQLRDAAGGWHDVPCDFGTIAVNGGVMLEMITESHFVSASHRVAGPDQNTPRPARMAMPLFLHPAGHVVLDGQQTAEAFLRERLRSNYRERSPNSS